MSTETAKRTPLYAEHQKLGARMTPFGGWDMPLQYTGILEEHRAVRNAAGLFDLGHMGQARVSGPDAECFVQSVATNDLNRIPEGLAQYSILCRPSGGTVDDIFVYRLPDSLFICLNASNTDKDIAWLQEQQHASGMDATVENVSDRYGMLAVQGPKAIGIVQRLTDTDLNALPRFGVVEATVNGTPTIVGRTGYTGEDGVELYPPIDRVVDLWRKLLEVGAPEGLAPIGLGARDTLRLEAKMALYGHELTEEINPLEAALSWAVAFDKDDFVGRDALRGIKGAGGPARRLVGFKMIGRGIPRADYPVAVNGETVGFVTSGGYAPTLDANIGLALVRRDVAGIGKPLDIIIRNQPVAAEQVRTPFYRRPEATEKGNA
ncbi:MAG: glycine cleavage system aminomethyltransferase GcvT [Thermomicrobiales bacterium]